MTGKNFRDAFPIMDEGFRCAVLQALEDIGKEREPVKRKISVGAVLVAAIVMLAAVAAAAVVGGWGMMDFLEGKSLPEAGEMIQSMEGQTAETELATFTLKEALYDGYGVYMTFSVRSKDPTKFLLPGGQIPGNKLSNLKEDGADLTIGEYAEGKGYEGYTYVGAEIDYKSEVNRGSADGLMFNTRAHLEEDDSLTLMLAAVASDLGEGQLTLQMMCGASDVNLTDTIVWQDRPSVQKASLLLKLQKTDTVRRERISRETVDMPAVGMTIQRVRLIQTPLTTYYEVDYTPYEKFVYNGSIRRNKAYLFGVVNGEGKVVYRSAVANISSMCMVDRETGMWRALGTLPASETLPDELQLQVSIIDDPSNWTSETVTIRFPE